MFNHKKNRSEDPFNEKFAAMMGMMQQQQQQGSGAAQAPPGQPQWIKGITVTLVLAGLGVGGYFIYNNLIKSSSSSSSSSDGADSGSSSGSSSSDQTSSDEAAGTSSGAAASSTTASSWSWKTALEIGIPAVVVIGALVLVIMAVLQSRKKTQAYFDKAQTIMGEQRGRIQSLENTLRAKKVSENTVPGYIDDLINRADVAVGQSKDEREKRAQNRDEELNRLRQENEELSGKIKALEQAVEDTKFEGKQFKEMRGRSDSGSTRSSRSSSQGE